MQRTREGMLCAGAACVCSQQEMQNALRAWKGLQLAVWFWLRRQNLEILIMFTLGQHINFPGFPTKHHSDLGPCSVTQAWLIYFQKGLSLTELVLPGFTIAKPLKSCILIKTLVISHIFINYCLTLAIVSLARSKNDLIALDSATWC